MGRQSTTHRAGRAAVVLAALVVAAGCAGGAGPAPPASTPSRTTSAPPDATTGSSPGAATDEARLTSLGESAADLGPAELEQMPARQQARLLGACAELDLGGVYCLGLGFLDDPPDLADLLAEPAPGASATGDVSYADWLRDRSAMPTARRLRAQREEVASAAAGLGKVAELREELGER